MTGKVTAEYIFCYRSVIILAAAVFFGADASRVNAGGAEFPYGEIHFTEYGAGIYVSANTFLFGNTALGRAYEILTGAFETYYREKSERYQQLSAIGGVTFVKLTVKAACDTFRALSCDGVARIDFIIDEATDEIFVNEINTIPGSLSFYLWEYSGYNFGTLVDKLIEIAFRRKQDAGFKAVNYGENIFAAGGGGGAKNGAKMGGKFSK